VVLALLAASTGRRRSVPAVALPLLTAALLGAPAADAARTPAMPAGAATVSRGVCTTSALDPQGRAVSFTVRMRDVPPTSSYGFDVRLQERTLGGRWRTLRANEVPDGFGDFEAARSGAPRMTRRITVRGLHPGSAYRLRVAYRWSAFGGSRATQRTSRSCSVKDVRPDVGLTGEFGWQPSTAGGEVAYRVGLRSDGLDALKGVDVPYVIRQGQSVLAMGTLRPSAATETVVLAGRRCMQGQPVTVQLDPDRVVDDRDAVDDLLSAPCVPVGR
jgi:hypothetical protein